MNAVIVFCNRVCLAMLETHFSLTTMSFLVVIGFFLAAFQSISKLKPSFFFFFHLLTTSVRSSWNTLPQCWECSFLPALLLGPEHLAQLTTQEQSALLPPRRLFTLPLMPNSALFVICMWAHTALGLLATFFVPKCSTVKKREIF